MSGEPWSPIDEAYQRYLDRQQEELARQRQEMEVTRKLLIVEANETTIPWTSLLPKGWVHELPSAEELGQIVLRSFNNWPGGWNALGQRILDALTKRREGGEGDETSVRPLKST